MKLESPKVSVDKSAQNLYDSLIDVKNFETLMPESTVKFEVINENTFIFGLKGMPEIQLQLKEMVAPNKIVFGAVSDKLPFSLITKIDSISENKANVQLFFEGEFNAMMAMMIKSPISKFIETLAENMNKL